ncbi:hypothetical protein QTP70_017524 [Hemibagrus guttatus]|uniref:Uncharacterized protein n=1 Tax=Hemibagrus guttatus TaxID=175788 RepID=A0AAE0QKS1_9TELE|nr:hypothetical protein QTP70_017524 [Hemibagrus guttatus]
MKPKNMVDILVLQYIAESQASAKGSGCRRVLMASPGPSWPKSAVIFKSRTPDIAAFA